MSTSRLLKRISYLKKFNELGILILWLVELHISYF